MLLLSDGVFKGVIWRLHAYRSRDVENTVGTSCVRSMKIAQTLGNIIYMIKHLLTFDSHFLLNVYI